MTDERVQTVVQLGDVRHRVLGDDDAAEWTVVTEVWRAQCGWRATGSRLVEPDDVVVSGGAGGD